jgi:hypothetical protein
MLFHKLKHSLTGNEWCTHCGIVCDKQSEFKNAVEVWLCQWYKQYLIRLDSVNGRKYAGIIWVCDRCEAVMI